MTVRFSVISHTPTAVPAPTSQILKKSGSYSNIKIFEGFTSR
jgi:hypothetical protein